MNAVNAYKMLTEDLRASIAQATQDVNEKTAEKGQELEAKAQCEADLADTTATRDADVKYLNDLTATCATKSSDFASRQQLRAEEIVAIEKAIEIISSAQVSGSADTYLPTLLQTKKTSLAQFASDSQSTKARAIAYLQKRATELKSQALSSIALH